MEGRVLSWIFFCLLLFHRTNALKPVEYCWYACEGALYDISFDGVADECTNKIWIESQFYCAAVYCTQDEIDAGYSYANDGCASYGTPLPSYQSIVPASFDLDTVERVNQSILWSGTKVDHAVVLDHQLFNNGYKTVTVFYGNYNLSKELTYSLYGYWGLVVLVGVAFRMLEAVKSRRNHLGTAQPTVSLSLSRIWHWTRRTLILPATMGQHCQEAIAGCTVPPRLETILIGLYFLLNLIYCFPGYHAFAQNVYYSQTRLQVVRYIADRTGILSIANVAIAWVFAARNDPLLWVTGWSFALFNRFHRAAARIATVQAIVHSICYSLFDFYYGGASNYYLDWSVRYWYCGQIATIAMAFMLPASMYLMRKHYYDLFLVLHIVLAIVVLVTLYYHINIFGGEYKPYIWACATIWSLDRLLRLARIVYASVLPRLLKGTKAIATYDAQGEMIRLDVTEYLKNKPLKPGQYYYIYLPAELRGYESHPFTLCSWYERELASPIGSPTASVTEKDDIEKGGAPLGQSASSAELNGTIRHTFLVRPYAGFTGRLKTRMATSLESQPSSQMTLLLEGPYGGESDLRRFSDVMIIAGGSGIAAAISHAHRLLHAGRTSIHIVWAVKQRQLVEDVCEHELRAVIDNERFNMVVYLTGAAVVDEKDDSVLHAPYQCHFGRPDILTSIGDIRRQCTEDLAVVNCGTPRMADACRKAVVDLLHIAGPNIEFYNETMLW